MDRKVPQCSKEVSTWKESVLLVAVTSVRVPGVTAGLTDSSSRCLASEAFLKQSVACMKFCKTEEFGECVGQIFSASQREWCVQCL